ncbi:hypothetical protein PMALA_058020 [Plasmodium malariae]|uniref:Fam-b protein n=1 Tax=Plasmodium malariae TaxID=5858 RepID=A0A1A8WZR5_PLAMA|nr:hypothetical protein PMALA_058020 [Plasmodium malariae]
MKQKNKFFFFTLLIWIFNYSYERTNFDKPCNKKIRFNNTSKIRLNRLLYGETDADSQETVFNLKKYFKDNFENSSNSLLFKDNSENTYDSLSSIDYLDGVNEELKEKPFRKKQYKSTENNISPLTSPHSKRLYSQFEIELPEQSHNEYKRLFNNFNEGFDNISIIRKNLLNNPKHNSLQ